MWIKWIIQIISAFAIIGIIHIWCFQYSQKIQNAQ